MALFGKGRTDRHSIIEVIKYDGPNDVLIWRFPNEDFNTNTHLIVGSAQEAILVKGGQVLGHFTPGTYTLNTKNYPFIRALVGLVTGGVSPFSCTVYYINKSISMGIEWGTDAPIRIIDPQYGVPVNLTSYGDFSVQVYNGQKLLEKLVGVTAGFSHDELRQYFTNLMTVQIRSLLTGVIADRHLSLYGIDVHLPELSAMAQERVAAIYEPYGLSVNHFVIARISYSGLEEIEAQLAAEAKRNIEFNQETQRHRVSTDLAAEDTVKAGRATAEANRALGFSAKEQAVAQMGAALAGNPGPMMGSAGGAPFPGLIGGSIVQPSASGASEIARLLLNREEAPAPAVPGVDGTMPGGLGFGMMEAADPGSSAPSAGQSFQERAMKVKFLFENGLITKEQYQERIDQLMSEI